MALHKSGEATHTNFIVFSLIRPGLELTIYRIRGEHANHYATDVVKYVLRNNCNYIEYNLTVIWLYDK